jgi:DNA-binding protein HU-beta
MNRKQLIEVLATHFQGNKQQAAQALDAVLETITREVARGEKVAIKGFGAFEKAVRPARMVRNPSTGDLIEASAKVGMRFRPSAQLRDVISGAAQLPARTLGAAMAAGDAFMGGDARSSRAPSKRNGEPAPPAPGVDDEATPANKATARTSVKKSTSAKKTTSGTAKRTAPAQKIAGAGSKKATHTDKTTSDTPAQKTTSGTAKKSATTKKTTAKKTTAKKTTAKKTTSGTGAASSTGSSS